MEETIQLEPQKKIEHHHVLIAVLIAALIFGIYFLQQSWKKAPSAPPPPPDFEHLTPAGQKAVLDSLTAPADSPTMSKDELAKILQTLSGKPNAK